MLKKMKKYVLQAMATIKQICKTGKRYLCVIRGKFFNKGVDDMKEVDTLSFMCLFADNKDREQILNNIINKTKKILDEEKTDCFYVGKYNKYSFWFSEEFYCLIITLKNSLTVGKTDLQIIQKTTEDITKYFNLNTEQIKIEKLSRIDYKKDYKIKNKEEKEIIKFLLDIAVDKIGKNYVKIIETNEGFYKVKYKNEGSGYVEIIFYDKENEMLQLAKKGKTTFAEASKYKGILRTEVRIKNRRLNYEKYKKGISKDIGNYYNAIAAKLYFDYYINKILGSERFYRIDIAIKIIQNVQTLKNNMKEKLCNLLKTINEKGFTKAKESYKNKKTFREHINKLKNLDISFLTFGTHINGKKIKAESIENFAIMNNDNIENKEIEKEIEIENDKNK